MPPTDAQAIESEMMGQDVALCGLLETLARVQPVIAKTLAAGIRSKARQLEQSNAALPAEAIKKATAYAEIVERIINGENPAKQNVELGTLTGKPIST